MPDKLISANIILSDRFTWSYLLPLTHTRPVADIRIGLRTIKEKWEEFCSGNISYQTETYLAPKYPILCEENNLIINASLLPETDIVNHINTLQDNEALYFENHFLAARISQKINDPEDLSVLLSSCKTVPYHPTIPPQLLLRPWNILTLLTKETLSDIHFLSHNRVSQKLSDTNRIIGGHPVFVEEGAKAECAVFNTTNGPIYLGKNSEVMEGSLIRGPFALGEGSTVNMGAKIYGPVAVGPKCKIGGEIKGTQFFGNANKGHEGFVGDSIIGEWCNLGADTNTSNLKNNYLPVRVWSYVEEKFVDTGLQFCGLIMGDHSKTGINTMFNTGTVTGAYCNIFGEGYPRNFIPSFTWGGGSGFQTHPLKKALETATIVFARRNVLLTEEDKDIAGAINEQTAHSRVWEKKEL
jgi:UDP-N-acetylglucosamine diphosphorylase/glucosamine-1-phosphate N-acetyltransferase